MIDLNRRPITEIIVHCSDSPDDRWVSVEEIRTWHIRDRGFRDIGYHYVVLKDGRVETGRNVNIIGAHCYGHNVHSIGVCWVGRHDCNEKQMPALVKLVKDLLFIYNLGPGDVKGHCEYESHKTCPNLPMDDFRKRLGEK
jgi:N-acetylmuramoyl-L-alanine amidase